jgi:hypothetical protein
MTDDKQQKDPNPMEPSASPRRAPYAGGGEAEGGEARPRRFSAQRKLETVQRLLRGEPLNPEKSRLLR